MNRARPRLAVVCVDGATPGFTSRLGLFRARTGQPPAALRSIYPSSTAPAHASILTGTAPAEHGIVANRYWEAESAGEIRARQEPLRALHPYDRVSLRARSFLDELLGAGLRVGAVLFPHTFSRQLRHPLLESCYCLYAPARRWYLPLRGMATPAAAADGAEQKGLPFTIRHFDESLTFQVTLVSRARPGPVVRIAGHGLTRDLSLGDVTDIVVQVNDEKAIAFALRLEVASPDEVLVAQSTAVLVIAAGEWPASRWADLVPPHSRSIDYTANTAHDFHESPSIEWVTSAALRLLATGPDVLFIRYNQADHAQEFLYWEATRGGAANSALAYNQIATAYRQIAAGVATIIEAVGPECIVVVVSDHGIDYVDTRLAPNRILAEMELSEYFIFQGDSNVCYLYGERPLTSAEWRRFEEIIQSAGRGKLRVMSTAELRARDAFHRGRCGVMALESAAHAEFQYHDAPLVQRARSASHGFDPHQPSMNGIWQVIQGPDVPRPASVRDVAGALRAVLAHNSQRDW